VLALTKKTHYALIALAHLAKNPDGVVSAREVAGAYDLPLPILTNVLKTLAQAGMVISERGATGGYGLAKPTDAITLHDLIVAIEGPFQFVRCSLLEPGPDRTSCRIEASCPIRRPAERFRERLRGFFENVTLTELIEDEKPPTVQREISPAKKRRSCRKELAS